MPSLVRSCLRLVDEEPVTSPAPGGHFCWLPAIRALSLASDEPPDASLDFSLASDDPPGRPRPPIRRACCQALHVSPGRPSTGPLPWVGGLPCFSLCSLI